VAYGQASAQENQNLSGIVLNLSKKRQFGMAKDKKRQLKRRRATKQNIQ
jgi:hypothetical protein